MTRKSLNRRVSWWIAGSAVGAAIVALPDSDQRVFSLSRTHGPAPLDLIGVTVLVAGWLPVALVLPMLWRTAGKVASGLSAALAAAGAAGLATTLAADIGGAWLVAASLLVAAQLVVIVDGWRLVGEPALPPE